MDASQAAGSVLSAVSDGTLTFNQPVALAN